MNKEIYNVEKVRRTIEITLMNYTNMIKRLERKKNISEFILTYYSVFLIITTLTGKYFPNYYHTTISDYFNLILSVVVLIYSLVIKNANYSTRIENILGSLNQLKVIKRELEDGTLEKCNQKYIAIIEKTERREDVDFFITVKNLCKSHNISWLTKKRKRQKTDQETEIIEYNEQEKIICDYISQINVILQQGKIIFEIIWDTVLFLIPIALFMICIIAKIIPR